MNDAPASRRCGGEPPDETRDRRVRVDDVGHVAFQTRREPHERVDLRLGSETAAHLELAISKAEALELDRRGAWRAGELDIPTGISESRHEWSQKVVGREVNRADFKYPRATVHSTASRVRGHRRR